MQTILIAGAGKSSLFLIKYLLSHAARNKWKIIVADGDARAIAEKLGNSPYGEAAVIDVTKAAEREPLVKRADIVVSLMPPHLHILLAKDCLAHGKNLITSSYISDEMKEMDKAVKEAGLMFMCEMGLDPGIDHMSANKIIHGIQKVSGTITSFKSYCGGLVAPESDNNPWHYKFTWNPRNVITAGIGGARYLSKGKHVDLPYEHMFEHNKKVIIEGLDEPLAYYPNRDSLRYPEIYDVPEVKTFLRATLRHPDFCIGWQALILMGLTSQNDAFDTKGHTYASWLKMKTGYNNTSSLPAHISRFLKVAPEDKLMYMLQWLGLFDDGALKPGLSTSADVLLDLLLEKWSMGPEEKDMVVMLHEIEYMRKDTKIKVTSEMMLKGESRDFSAMAKTVGLPIGMLARMVLEKKIKPPIGVLLPNMSAVYRPVLVELAHHGISFKEEVS
jgi:saccharopine dehydrogenase-like NADP-dependent oxidoreductase